MTNPITRKVAKCEDVGAKEHITYKGIAVKVIFFLLFCAVGIGVFQILKELGPKTGVADFTIKETFLVSVENIRLAGMIGLLVALVLFIVSPIVTAFKKGTAPFNGVLYCTATGYIVAFTGAAVADFRLPIFAAFCLTIALFIALALIYSTGKIKVTAKFKSAFFGVLLASLLFSLLLFIFSLIPPLRFIPEFFRANTVLGIVFSVIGLIIAVIFVIVDFSVIQEAVDRKLPKEYEWFCAYALTFSLIYLYFKILDILLRVLGKSKSK